MATQRELLDAHAKLTRTIRASEVWEKSYKDSPETFQRLLREEAALQASALAYLSGLGTRAAQVVNWTEVPLKPLMASAVPPASDPFWIDEQTRMTVWVADHMLELMVIGGQAGEFLYNRIANINNLDADVLLAAERHTAKLVSGVTNTTRTLIQRAIKQSIAKGENAGQATQRIMKLVGNPIRAEMIAQTESVNAYQQGLEIFGQKTGVKSYTWDALLGACELCAPLDGKTMKRGEMFTLGNGTQVLSPPGHVRCRCGRIANY